MVEDRLPNLAANLKEEPKNAAVAQGLWSSSSVMPLKVSIDEREVWFRSYSSINRTQLMNWLVKFRVDPVYVTGWTGGSAKPGRVDPSSYLGLTRSQLARSLLRVPVRPAGSTRKAMANNLYSTSTAAATTTTIIILFSLLLAGKSQTFSTNLPRSALRLGRENVTQLHFFFHDVVGGPNATAIRVAAAPITNTSTTGFGAVIMMDNLLTVGPEPNSTRVGRAQGMYASADLNNMSFMMVQNYVFDEERYNGSTLSILGRNPITSPMREFPVVGGTGVFRFARGYAEARTYFLNATNGDAIVEYNSLSQAGCMVFWMAIATHGMRSFRCSRTGVMMVLRSWPVQTSRGMGGDTAPFVPIPERRRVIRFLKVFRYGFSVKDNVAEWTKAAD
ncbi:hypothetical protein LXL04_032863 [Taraxacum kok-saghyz]